LDTYANDLILGTSCKVLAIWTEAHTSDVQVAVLVNAIVLQVADLLSSIHIEYLRTTIAASRDKATIMAETNAAYNALMREIVHKIDIKPTWHARVENGMPVFALALEMWWKLVRFEIGELVADAFKFGVRVLEVYCDLGVRVRWWGRTSDARRTWIRVGLVLLGSCRSAEAASTDARAFTWTWRSSGLGCLWTIPYVNR
jgi:hypothetical protein